MKKALCAVLGVILAALSGCAGSPAEQNGSAAPSQTMAQALSSAPTEAHTQAAETASTTAQNTLKAENISDDGTFKTYTVDGSVRSVTGIDVSSYCGDIDWERVGAAGVAFAMVRLGGRGYGTDGALYSDDRAAEYFSGAQAAGVKTGGYFFSQAVTPEEAREEAAFCKQLLGDLTPDYPIAYDLEFIKDDEARTDGMTVEQATDCARAFCDEIRRFGWTPLIYAGDAELAAKYDLSRLADCGIWYCEYADAPNAPFPVKMWQYSKTAVIDGIEGNVDLDMMLTD